MLGSRATYPVIYLDSRSSKMPSISACTLIGNLTGKNIYAVNASTWDFVKSTKQKFITLTLENTMTENYTKIHLNIRYPTPGHAPEPQTPTLRYCKDINQRYILR